MFCDNMSVVMNATFPESSLKKKHGSVAYAKIRAAISAGIVLIYYESSETNVADLLTKVLSYSRRTELIRSVLE